MSAAVREDCVVPKRRKPNALVNCYEVKDLRSPYPAGVGFLHCAPQPLPLLHRSSVELPSSPN